jgi:cytochrome c5
MKRFFALILLVSLGVMLFSCGGGSDKAAKTYTANLENGKAVFNKVCVACHLTGVAGAAKLTDKARWEEYAAQGIDAMHHAVINGVPNGKYGVMPARGTCTDCSDQDLFDAVSYIVQEAGVTPAKK